MSQNLVPATQDLQLTLYSQYEDQTFENVLHYHSLNSGPQTVDLEQILPSWDTVIRAKYLALLPTETIMWGYKLQVWPANNNYRPSYLSRVGQAGWEGTGGDEGIPSQCGIIISLRGQQGGRRNRGRIYLPSGPLPGYQGATRDMGVNYMANVGTLTAAITQLTFMVAAGTQKWNLAIAHRSSGTMTDAVLITAAASLATQRRRGQYGRPNRPPYPAS